MYKAIADHPRARFALRAWLVVTVVAVLLCLPGLVRGAEPPDATLAPPAPKYYLRPDGSVEKRLDDLESRVDAIEKKLKAPAEKKAAKDCPCDGCDCPSGQCPDCPAAADPRAHTCRLQLGMHGGSGTVIWSEGGYSLILTNKHVATCGGEVTVFHGGRQYPGHRGAFAAGCDLGIVWVRAELPACRLATADPAPGTKVRHWGIGSGRGAGAITGTTELSGEVSLTGTFNSVSGDSGAGLFNDRNELVGVNWGFIGTGAGRGPSCAVPVSHVWALIQTSAVPNFPRLRELVDRLHARNAIAAPPRSAASGGCPGGVCRPAQPFNPFGGCPGGSCQPSR